MPACSLRLRLTCVCVDCRLCDWCLLANAFASYLDAQVCAPVLLRLVPACQRLCLLPRRARVRMPCGSLQLRENRRRRWTSATEPSRAAWSFFNPVQRLKNMQAEVDKCDKGQQSCRNPA